MFCQKNFPTYPICPYTHIKQSLYSAVLARADMIVSQHYPVLWECAYMKPPYQLHPVASVTVTGSQDECVHVLLLESTYVPARTHLVMMVVTMDDNQTRPYNSHHTVPHIRTFCKGSNTLTLSSTTK